MQRSLEVRSQRHLSEDEVAHNGLGLIASGGGHFFVIGSCVGYVSSALFFYRNQIRQAFIAFDDYPRLMRLHLIMNFPMMQFQHIDMRPSEHQAVRERFARSWRLSSMLAAAYQTANPSIDVSTSANMTDADLESGGILTLLLCDVGCML